MKRARKMARNKLAAKYLKGKDLSKLSFNDRKRLEDRLKGKEKLSIGLLETFKES